MRKRIIFITMFLCMMLSVSAMAHSGRTDSQGGHKDNKNVSGLGSYHYHCGGNPAHLHPDGVCPYKQQIAVPSVKTPQKKEKTSPSDIKVFINEKEIPAFNYQNSCYVLAEDLSNFGFDVDWQERERKLNIERNQEKAITAQSNAMPFQTYDIEKTDITVIARNPSSNSDETLQSYNIDGQMIIRFDDLGIFGLISWDEMKQEFMLTLN